MASERATLFLAEVSTPHADSPAYQTCPIVALTVEEASRKASRWAVLVVSHSDQQHHLRLVQDEEVVWTRAFGGMMQA